VLAGTGIIVVTERLATREGKFFTHQELWYDLQDILAILEADQHPRRGLFTAAIVLIYACLEAHVNFLGQELYPGLWQDDKDGVGDPRLRGTLAKVAFLYERLGIPLDRTRASYSILRQLKRRRDQFAHPRIETRSHRVTVEEANRLRPIDSEYSRLLTRSFVRRALKAVTETASVLQAAAHEQFPHKILGPQAFVGILGIRGVSIDT
jgi:hypothetical protein